MKRFTAPDNSSTDEYGKLLAALKAEESQAVGYDTSAEVTKHTEALDRYFGKPYGDEIEGRSKITTREIYETVAWTVPDILDIFAAGGRICDLEADDEESEAQKDERADYLNYVFFKDNAGVLILHDFIFDSLMHPRGYVDVDWDAEPAYAGWEEYEGLSFEQAQMIVDAPNTEVDPKSIKEEPQEGGEVLVSMRARQKLRNGCCKIEVVPPEDMFVAGRSTEMASARYKGRLLRWRRSIWKQHFPKMRNKIEEYSGSDDSNDADERRAARFDDSQAEYSEWATAASKAAQELVGRKEYIWYADPDSEDDAVLLRVYRLGDLVLDVEEVDDDPFASASSHRVPHRLQGLSIPEVLGDLQKLKTVLTRALVDGTMQANVPRMAAKDGVNLDDLMNLSHGAIIRTGQLNPSEGLMPVFTPDLSASTLKALEWTNQIIEQRSGVARHAQGMDPDSLNHTAKGIQLLQNAANAVKRLLARLIAVGVEEMMTKVDRTIMRHQKTERQVKLGKQFVKVDPRSWSPSMRIVVSVGLGTGAKDAQLAFLQMIQQDQVAWVANYGVQTPVVTPMHLYNTVTEKLRVMGYQSAEKFFGEPMVQNPQTGAPEPYVPQTPPSPDQQKVQAQMQEGQARLQMDAQKAQMDAQVKQFETQAKAGADVQKAQLDAQIQTMKAEAEIALAREKMALEMQMKREQMSFEMDMQRQQFEFEKQISQQESDAKVEAIEKQASAKGKLNGSGGGVTETKFGGEPG